MSVDDDRTVGGAERDAHLQAALRHAPDASLAAPPSLGDAILLQARIAARAAPSTADRPVTDASARSRPRWIEALDRSTRWWSRPAVAAGFASVTAATLIGLMWWDRPLPPTETPSASPWVAPSGADAPKPKLGAVPAASQDAPMAAPPRRFDEVDRRSSTLAKAAPVAEPTHRTSTPTPAATPVPPTDPERPTTAPVVAQAGAPLESRAGTGERVRAETAVTDKESAGASRSRAVAAAAPTPAMATSPATGTTPAVVAALTAPAPAADAAPADRLATVNARRQQASPATSNLLQRRAQDGHAAVRPSSVGAGSPLEALRLSIASEPARWRWRRDQSDAAPMNDAVVRWVDAFDTRASWSAPAATSTNELGAGHAPQAFTDIATPPVKVELLRDGAVEATLDIDVDGRLALTLAGPPARRERATPSPAALADLRARAPLPVR